MPKFMELFGYNIYFWSNEGEPLEPLHVHVAKSITSNATKIWITKNGKCILENNNSNISPKELKKIMGTLEIYSEDLIETWKEYFKADVSFKE